MSAKKPLVGFDRYVEKQWMDEVARLVVDGRALIETNAQLDDFLMPLIQGDTSRRKTKKYINRDLGEGKR